LRSTGKIGQGEGNCDSMSGFIKRLEHYARREYPGNMVLLREWGALSRQSTKASAKTKGISDYQAQFE
jgi:hypothetical protein